jgi:hypothetical protein
MNFYKNLTFYLGNLYYLCIVKSLSFLWKRKINRYLIKNFFNKT